MAAKRGAAVEPKSGVSPRKKLTATAVGRKTEARSPRAARHKPNDVEQILDAASKLLSSKGLGAFNMNAVAALAAVDLPTLHSHFKDKTAVLLALYEKTMAERTSGILEMIQQLRSGTETETISWVQSQIDKLVDLQLENPAHVALRRAIRAVPELTAADERLNASFAQAIDYALRSVLPEMDARRARTVARTVVEAGTALIEYCAMHPKEARGMSREIGVMIVGYVREVLKSV
jgi:AcrR family transcriptional regulator